MHEVVIDTTAPSSPIVTSDTQVHDQNDQTGSGELFQTQSNINGNCKKSQRMVG